MHKQTLIFGLIGGLFFFAHAMLNNSHAWPLVWPALAGVFAVWSARDGTAASYGTDLKKAATAGLIAGAVFVIATAIALTQMDALGSTGVAGLSFAALVGLLASVIAGALVHPVVRRT